MDSSESCQDHDCKCDLTAQGLSFFYVITVQPKHERSKHTVRNTRICTSVTSCPITNVSLVTHSRLTLPQAKDRLPPLIWPQHAVVVHAGALRGAPYTPPLLPGRISQWSVKAAQRQDLY